MQDQKNFEATITLCISSVLSADINVFNKFGSSIMFIL